MGKWAATILRPESLNINEIYHYLIPNLGTLEIFGAILVLQWIRGVLLMSFWPRNAKTLL